MRRKDITEEMCREYAADRTAGALSYRRYDDGGSVDERRKPLETDRAIVRGAITGALYAWRGGYCDAKTAADVAEFVASAIESALKGQAPLRHEDWRIQSYDDVYTPITAFAADVKE